ncbi:MAG TPA: DUF3237 family protein [Gemmataceae bacterium]|nr:DUF3237 family protein [Gemmataceae bacterium]
MPEGIPSPESGVKIFEAEMQLDQIYDLGKTQYGQRQVLIVKSGTVKGEKLNGTVLPGGLDFQLKISNGVVEIEQILVLKTSDGKNMYVRNAGTGENQNDLRIVANFVAPNDGAYAWLNSGKFVSRRVVDSTAKTMTWTVYNVSDVKMTSDPKDIVKISKPADVKAQPWDFRKAAASEKKGNQIITETVTLGQGISVGAAKKGNILPITGGKVSGKITGKVLAAGADYQNLSKGAAIDARYLWQTDDGEIIIVRNAGGFGGLVPTFEVRADSKYAWLNSGTYLSSNPGGAAGGVSLTFYESK